MSTDTNKSFEWRNTEEGTVKSIELTVALPALNSKKIIWLALESLRRQVKVTFGWELLVWEEHGVSKEIVESFIGQLPNCQRIKFKALDPIKDGNKRGKYKGRILLLDKWVWMAMASSPTSKVYVLQAADCYSSPHRLFIHYQHFTRHPKCYLSTQPKGLFYNIHTGGKILYDGHPFLGKRTHLNMAYRTRFMRTLPNGVQLPKKIDTYIYNYFAKRFKLRKKNIYYDSTIMKDNWRYSIDTDGYNNISLSLQKHYKRPKLPFTGYKYSYKIKHYIPQEVRDFLKSIKK